MAEEHEMNEQQELRSLGPCSRGVCTPALGSFGPDRYVREKVLLCVSTKHLRPLWRLLSFVPIIRGALSKYLGKCYHVSIYPRHRQKRAKTESINVKVDLIN